MLWVNGSLKSRGHFGKRLLSVFVEKIIAPIFEVNGRVRLGREIILYQGGDWQSKIRRGVGKLIFLPFPTPYPNCLVWLQIKHSCLDKPLWADDCNLLLLNACTASTLIDKRESEMMSFLYEWLMFCPLHFHMVWDNLGTLLPSPLLSPPPPSSIFFSYLLKIPAFPGVKFHFLTALPSFYIFLCRNPWHTCTDSWKSNYRTSGFHWPMNIVMVMNMFHRKRNRKAQHPPSSINLYIKLSSQA